MGGEPKTIIPGAGGEPKEASVVASALPTSSNPQVEEMRAREARVEDSLGSIDPMSPKHKQVERALVAARKKRKRLEREAKATKA